MRQPFVFSCSDSDISTQSISTGTGVKLVGKWKASPTTKSQCHELVTDKLDVVAQVDAAVRNAILGD